MAADPCPGFSPAPFPARMADWRTSALASSTSWRRSVLRSSATSENSSPTDARESGACGSDGRGSDGRGSDGRGSDGRTAGSTGRLTACSGKRAGRQ